jgi:hypothetical protein
MNESVRSAVDGHTYLYTKYEEPAGDGYPAAASTPHTMEGEMHMVFRL